MLTQTIHLTENPAIAGRMDRYITITVDVAKVLGSWRQSLMAHEWLNPDGALRDTDHLNMLDRDKVLITQKALKDGQPLPRPVLGIGILDNIEIGAGRDVFYVAAAAGHRAIDVHIPRSNEADFRAYLG